MKLRGFLIIIVLAGGLLYLLWLLQVGREQQTEQGGKEQQLPPQVRAYRAAELQATKANMLTLKTAIFMFTAEEGQTPKDLKELKKFGGLHGANLDSWGTPIRYKRLSDEHFRLISAGKDKIFNNSDDIVEEY